MTSNYPTLVLLLSGKRKSGKDYIAEKLLYKFGKNRAVIIRLSGPLKSEYAKIHELNTDMLMDDSSYKETYRKDMIKWGEEIRCQNPSFFCEKAIIKSNACDYPIWIISDARRLSDLEFFSKTYGNVLKTIRIFASDEVRIARGWKFTQGVDDAESECGLDQVEKWDLILPNDGNEKQTDEIWKKFQATLQIN